MDTPQDLLYSKEHEWVRLEEGRATVGVTDHAQSELGDVVFVELPEVGAALSHGDAAASLESVKAVSEVYTPVSGKVTEVNGQLEEAPETINSDPYGEGWIFKIEIGGKSDLDGLMSAADYDAFVKEETD